MSSRDELLLNCGTDGLVRCWWCCGDRLYEQYHDHEWGFPQTDDVRLFEKICLEGFQAGLSWITILRKRENFRRAFHGFNMQRIARYTKRDVSRLLADAGIVRHRGKIEAVMNNARCALDVAHVHGSLAAYLWQFAPAADQTKATPVPDWSNPADIPATSAASHALSRDLRRRGFRFVGPTTMYAFMQSVGMVNDHVPGCPARETVRIAVARMYRPGER